MLGSAWFRLHVCLPPCARAGSAPPPTPHSNVGPEAHHAATKEHSGSQSSLRSREAPAVPTRKGAVWAWQLPPEPPSRGHWTPSPRPGNVDTFPGQGVGFRLQVELVLLTSSGDGAPGGRTGHRRPRRRRGQRRRSEPGVGTEPRSGRCRAAASTGRPEPGVGPGSWKGGRRLSLEPRWSSRTPSTSRGCQNSDSQALACPKPLSLQCLFPRP